MVSFLASNIVVAFWLWQMAANARALPNRCVLCNRPCEHTDSGTATSSICPPVPVPVHQHSAAGVAQWPARAELRPAASPNANLPPYARDDRTHSARLSTGIGFGIGTDQSRSQSHSPFGQHSKSFSLSNVSSEHSLQVSDWCLHKPLFHVDYTALYTLLFLSFLISFLLLCFSLL